MKISKFVTVLVLLMLSHCLFVPSPCSSAESPQILKTEYTFGVVPQAPPEVMHRNWLPFIDRLSHDTGLALKLKVYEDMNDFEANLEDGSIDFAYMNPVQEIMAWNENGYIPLVRSKNLIRGCIFVRKDSGLHELNDLDGKKIALVGSKNVGCITVALQVIAVPDVRGLRLFPLDWKPKANGYACLAISDTGCGIDTTTLEKIFDPFFSTKFIGRGLGLSVVLGLVGAYDGAIGVESQPDQGTVVRVFFPLGDRTHTAVPQ